MKPSDVGGPELPNPGSLHNPTRQRDIPIATPGQGVEHWHGEHHPFYGLGDLIEDALFMLTTGKRRKTVAGYIERILSFLPYFERQVGNSRRRLLPVAIRLKMAISAPTTKDMDLLLEEARAMLAAIIVADEDAKFPGCRNADGELVLGGGGDE